MTSVAHLTRAAALRLAEEMAAAGIEEVRLYRLDTDSRWIVAEVAGSERRPVPMMMISRDGYTPDEEQAERERERLRERETDRKDDAA